MRISKNSRDMSEVFCHNQFVVAKEVQILLATREIVYHLEIWRVLALTQYWYENTCTTITLFNKRKWDHMIHKHSMHLIETENNKSAVCGILINSPEIKYLVLRRL